MAESENNIYLNLELRKSEGKTDSYGNYFFEVEASNENLDLQNQIVLQSALMESKDEFLRGGVISYDHLHRRREEDGHIVPDPSMIIGEPVDVIFDGKTKKTVVRGKLYSTNEKAKEIIKLLKAGSTRVRASVGGILPRYVRNAETGVEKVTHVLWNDLALTVTPVNNTVGSAVFAKGMSAREFVGFLPDEVKKALLAGYGTDSAEFTGGRALIPEDTGNAGSTAEENGTEDEDVLLEKLADLAVRGRIRGEKDAVDYLVSQGMDKAKAGMLVPEIIKQGRQMMGKSFSDAVAALLKSLSGGNPKDEDEVIEKGGEEGNGNPDPDPDEEADGTEYSGWTEGEDPDEDEPEEEDSGEEDEEDGEDEGTGGDGGKAGNAEGSEVLKALDSELKDLRKSVKDLHRQNGDLGKAVVGLAEMLAAIGNKKIPARSVFAKSFDGTHGKGGVQQQGRPTVQDLYRAQDVLIRCVESGKIDLRKSSMISSDIQRCMATGAPMKAEYFDFLQKEFAKEVK